MTVRTGQVSQEGAKQENAYATSQCLKIASVIVSLPKGRNQPVAAALGRDIKCCADTCVYLIPAQTSVLLAWQGGERIY